MKRRLFSLAIAVSVLAFPFAAQAITLVQTTSANSGSYNGNNNVGALNGNFNGNGNH